MSSLFSSSMLSDEEHLLKNNNQKDNSSDSIEIDHESDIIDPSYADEMDPEYRPETAINALNRTDRFVFPSSPQKHRSSSWCQCGVRDYFRPILPQISQRSLRQNAVTLNAKRE